MPRRMQHCDDCEWALPRGDENGKHTFFCYGGPPAATLLNGQTTTGRPVLFAGERACRVFEVRRPEQKIEVNP